METPSGKRKKCNLSNVLYVPNLSYNLLSVTKSTDTIKSTVFTSKECDFLNAEGKVVATGKRIGELYYLNCRDTQQATAAKHVVVCLRRNCGIGDMDISVYKT